MTSYGTSGVVCLLLWVSFWNQSGQFVPLSEEVSDRRLAHAAFDITFALLHGADELVEVSIRSYAELPTQHLDHHRGVELLLLLALGLGRKWNTSPQFNRNFDGLCRVC